MLEIVNVLPRGTAARLDLKPGDVVVSVNGRDVNDSIDFQFFSADEQIRVIVRKQNGSTKKFNILKAADDNLGLEFSPLQVKKCRNNCIFCFVDQMPPGCRSSLYVKDDDFRASFLFGNFITLSALGESDWERIFKQRLSPLYISVHATDPSLRASMLRNKKAPAIMESLKRLAAGGIRMHCQIVLCPGINDGEHLIKTVNDLAGLFPAVASIAVVPVGITAFRKKLFALRPFYRREASAVFKAIRPFWRQFKKRFGSRLVFPSDELYIKAGETIPSSSFYEDFPQIENGVGMVAAFLREVSKTGLPSKIEPVSATVITGLSFNRILENVLKRLSRIDGLTLRQVPVKNLFFGPSVTVTGLLSGGDILHALKGKRLGDMVLIPSNTLREDCSVFLDGMSLEQLQRELKVKVLKVEGFKHMIDILRRKGRRTE